MALDRLKRGKEAFAFIHTFVSPCRDCHHPADAPRVTLTAIVFERNVSPRLWWRITWRLYRIPVYDRT